MDKKLTRKEFIALVGSLVGLFILSRIPGSKKLSSALTSTKKTGAYGNGSYGGAA